MSNYVPGHDTPSHSSRTAVAIAVAIAFFAVYSLVVYVSPAAWWPKVASDFRLSLLRGIFRFIDRAFHSVGVTTVTTELRNGAYLVLMAGVVPWLLMIALRRGRPYDLGVRLPNRVGWRILFVGYLAALPFQYWMVLSPGFSAYYGPRLEHAGFMAFISFYVVNMLTEHFFFHGVLLSVCRDGRRWPSPPPVATNAESRGGRLGQWLGLAQPDEGTRGFKRMIRWIGLPVGCVPAIIASATLFGVIHIGKDARELLLSVPGGIALAYVAYRSNSWIIPYLLHLATAGTALAMMIAMS